MNREIREQVGAHTAKHWTERDGGCPMCGCSRWDAHGYVNITFSRSHMHDDPGPKPVGFPAAAMTCTGCGYVAMLNLTRAGITPRG